ncbi:uncharacterized protein LOC136025124 isoform X2 [Artemia franciscana]
MNRSKETVAPVQRNSDQREERSYQREERTSIGQREERINEDRILQEIFLLKKEMSRVSVELLAIKQQNESQEAVNSLRKDVSTLQGEMQVLIAGMSEISGKEDRFERTLEKYSEKHDQLKNEIRRLDKEFKNMKDSLKGLGKDFKALWVDTKSISAIHEDFMGLETKFESYKAMEARMVSKFETMSKLKADVDLASRDIYSLRGSLDKKLEAFYELEKRMTKLSAVDHHIKKSNSPESFSIYLKKVEEVFSKKIARIESFLDEINQGKVKSNLFTMEANFSKDSMGAQEELPERTADVPTERIVKLLDRKANEPAAAKPESTLKIVKNKANESTTKEPENAVERIKNNRNPPAGEDTETIDKTGKRKVNELAVEVVGNKRLKNQDQCQIQEEKNVAVITNLNKPCYLTRGYKYRLLSEKRIQIESSARKIGQFRKTEILPFGKVYYMQWLSFPVRQVGQIECMLQSCKQGNKVIETVLFGWIGKKPQVLSSNCIAYAKAPFHSLGFELVNDKIAKVNFIIDNQLVWLDLKVEMLTISTFQSKTSNSKKTCSNLSAIPNLAWKRIKYFLGLDESYKPHIIKANLYDQVTLATLGEQEFKEQSLRPAVLEIENCLSVLELERTSNSLAAEVTDNLNPSEMIFSDAIYESEISQKDDHTSVGTSIDDEVNLKDNLPVAPEKASPIKDSFLNNPKQTEVRKQESFKPGDLKSSIKWRPKSLDKSEDIFHSYVGSSTQFQTVLNRSFMDLFYHVRLNQGNSKCSNLSRSIGNTSPSDPQNYEDPGDMESVPHENIAVESRLPAPSMDEVSPKSMSQSAITSYDIEIIDENIPLKNLSSLKNLPDQEPSELLIVHKDFLSEKSLVESAQENWGDKGLHDIEIIDENIPLENPSRLKNLPDEEPSEISVIQNNSASEKSCVESAQDSCVDKGLYDTLSQTTEKQSFNSNLGNKEHSQTDDIYGKTSD